MPQMASCSEAISGRSDTHQSTLRYFYGILSLLLQMEAAQKEIRLESFILNQCAPNGSNRALMTGRQDKIFCWLNGV